MSFFSSKKESDVVLVFDIGSGSVGGAIVFASRTHSPTILYTFRSDIPFQEEATGARLLSLMLRSLSQVVMAITHEGFDLAGFKDHRPHIREVVVSLGAPWVISKTSVLTLRNEKPIPITEKVFSELLKHSESETRPAESELPKERLLLEQRLIKSVLNGYGMDAPYGKEALTAEFSVFKSFSVPAVTGKIEDTVRQLVHTDHLTFHAFALLGFLAIKSLSIAEDNFMFVDVSGEQTELALVKGGALLETLTFPFGKNRLVRTLKRHTAVPLGGIAALAKLTVEGKGTGRLFERSEKVLQEAMYEWQKEFSKTLSNYLRELFLPRLIFLTADDDVTPLFAKALESSEWNISAVSPATSQIVLINNDAITSLVSYSSTSMHDPFLGLISASLGTLRME